MASCRHLKNCEFVLLYVKQVKPHWDDFVNLYCHGDFQDVCKRLEAIEKHGRKPEPELMPTGQMISGILLNDKKSPA